MNALETIDKEITGLFTDITQVIWRRLAPILGIVTTQHLFRQAGNNNLERFPWLDAVKFTKEGLSFDEIDGVKRPNDEVELRRGLATVVTTILEILTVLTGDILTRDLQPSVSEFVKRASTAQAEDDD